MKGQFQSHKAIKIIAILALIWYVFGIFQFVSAYKMDVSAALNSGQISNDHAALLERVPTWVWWSFGLAALLGAIGALALFLGSKRSSGIFWLSLLSAVTYYLWLFVLSGAARALPASEFVIAAMVIGVSLVMAIYSSKLRGT